jgi:hypothetical protein
MRLANLTEIIGNCETFVEDVARSVRSCQHHKRQTKWRMRRSAEQIVAREMPSIYQKELLT